MASLSDHRRLRNLTPQPEVDVVQAINEAQVRWLRPVEVSEILSKYSQYGFKLNPVAPYRPKSGSMFLFDRKVLRYFRKDGHNWRKKKDGKTVREAHERLKTGSVDTLHCYYAHGEESGNFQRRCYWMLDPAMEHIVLVHYREVTEGTRFPTSESHCAPLLTSSPEVNSSTVSLEVEAEEGDNDEHVSALEGPVPSHQPSLLEQVSPGVPVAPEIRSAAFTSNSWSPVLQPVQMDGGVSSSLTSSSWMSAHSVQGENLLSSTTRYPRQTSASELGQRLDKQLDSILATVQDVMSTGEESQLPMDYAETSSDIANLDSLSFADLLNNSETNDVGQGSLNQAITLDMTGWNLLLEDGQRNQPSVTNSRSGDMGTSFGNQSAGGAGIYVKQDSMKGFTWADMLEQCTTPATQRQLLDSLMSNNPTEMIGLSESSGTQDVPSASGVPSPKGILEALSPRGLGREPQTPLEARLRDATEENALKAAEGNHRHHPAIQPDLQHMDDQWDIKPSELEKYLKLDSFKNCNFDSLAKLDSFGRWMGKEMGEGGQQSPVPGRVQSGLSWDSTLQDQGVGEDIATMPTQIQGGTELSESPSQAQNFNIVEYSPAWSFSAEETKVLITGTFLQGFNHPSDYKWCCMFGEVEVPAELLETGVLRCTAPAHAPGRVPFYVTCGDRQAHSQVLEFEYRLAVAPNVGDAPHIAAYFKSESEREEEMMFKVRLARMLLADANDQEWGMHGSISHIDVPFCLDSSHSNDEWESLEMLVKGHADLPASDFQEQLLQMLLKYRMQTWLLRKVQEEGKGPAILDHQGQSVFHMVAALGYVWAVAPLLASGIPINFRDVHGWTALHWAASCGREQVVVTLLGAGADPGTVTDPTPNFTAGQTPADLAASNGHGGISGFLAESSLTCRLSSMSLTDKGVVNDADILTSQIVGDEAVAKMSRRASIQRSMEIVEDQLSMIESLQALRNATQAAALIQAAFRQHSFRKRDQDFLSSMHKNEFGLTESQVRKMLAAQKIQRAYRGHQEKKMRLAATRIQQKFRGWKGRKDFLLIRQRIVKLQAHMRGTLVRRRLKLLWAVSVVEKAVLRWRRRTSGLRGFRTGEGIISDAESDDLFLIEKRRTAEAALEKAVIRVQSMVRSRQARAQYRRLLEEFRQTQQHGQMSQPASPQDDQLMTFTSE